MRSMLSPLTMHEPKLVLLIDQDFQACKDDIIKTFKQTFHSPSLISAIFPGLFLESSQNHPFFINIAGINILYEKVLFPVVDSCLFMSTSIY